ncbi:MAG: hypothetical protein K2M64_00265 [Clostridia bacterium]|nr:hypothetical protein [Clostridia bacterium]
MAKQNLKERLVNRKIKTPNKLIAWVVFKAFKSIVKKQNVKYNYELDLKKYLKEQVVILAQHGTKDEYLYTLAGFNKYDVHCVIGHQNFFNKKIYGLLLQLGTISKYLYQTDYNAVKQMLSVVKNGESLLLYPEGIQSTSGSTHPINPATIKLLKKCGLPVILCTSQGSYLTRPRYSAKQRKGQITVTYKLLFEKEDLTNLTEDELYNKLLDNFRYNEFEHNKQVRIPFKGKCENIEGLDKIIYKCPHCGAEFDFKIDGKIMSCNACGYQVEMNDYYDLLQVNMPLYFDDIDKWYKWQRQEVKKEVAQSDFELSRPVKAYNINYDKLKDTLDEVGEGILTVNNHYIIFDGKYNGEEKQLKFDIKGVPSMPFSPNDGSIDMFYNGEYYNFGLTSNKLEAVKFMLAVEEIHNMYDPNWANASKDVYE